MQASSKNETGRIRTLIADDYPPFRRLLREFLACEPSIELVGEAESGQDAVDKARDLAPDVILMDISLPDMPGLEALRLIKFRAPGMKVIVLLEEDSREYRSAAFETGATACLVKELSGKELPSVIKAL